MSCGFADSRAQCLGVVTAGAGTKFCGRGELPEFVPRNLPGIPQLPLIPVLCPTGGVRAEAPVLLLHSPAPAAA